MSRATVVKLANTYLQSGLVDHDPDSVALAPRCIRVENGWANGMTRDGIAAGILAMPPTFGVRNVRWIVQGQEAVASFELQMGGERVVHITELFRVSGGLIREIRPTFFSGDLMPSLPADPPLAARNLPRRAPEQAAVQVARRFLSALQRRKLTAAPVGRTVMVTDNGARLGADKTAFSTWFQSRSEQWTNIWGERWLAEGHEVVGIYQVERPDGSCLWVSDYFRIYDSLVQEIHSNWGRGAPRVRSRRRGQPHRVTSRT